MPFNTLLLTCLKHGTSFQDPDPRARGKVSIVPGTGETILFFPIDDQQQRNAPCLMRQELGLSKKPVCDLLVFFANESEEIVLCLVELKGRDVAHAVEQIEETYAALNELAARSSISPRLWQRVHLKGYILMHGSMPQDVKKFKKPLEKLFGKGNYDIKSQKENQGDFLGDFLRQTQDQKQQKKDKPARKQKR